MGPKSLRNNNFNPDESSVVANCPICGDLFDPEDKLTDCDLCQSCCDDEHNGECGEDS